MILNALALCMTAFMMAGTGADSDNKDIIKERIKPVIIYPQKDDKVYSEDSLAVRYYSEENKDGYIILSDEDGVVNVTKMKSGSVFYNSLNTNNSHITGRGGVYLIDEKYLEPDKKYSIQMVSDFVVSDPVYFTTFTGGEELIKRILEKKDYDVEKLPVEVVAPSQWFTSADRASAMMETITVKIWKIDENGNKYPTTSRLTVNKNIRNNYINAFNEIFALQFPIKSLGCYNYRNTHGGRLSEHALGTAVDINPDENYCRYSDGSTVGRLYKPYENPYSVTPEVVEIFKKYGFGWGGDWGSTPDYMHFSYFET